MRSFFPSSVVGSLLAAVITTGAAASLALLTMTPGGCTRVVASASPTTTATLQFTTDGKLLRPTGFRKWPVVGTPLTPNDMNNGAAPFPEFHQVYMDPESFAHYEKTGEFRNGTVLVKDLISVGSNKASSGNGYFMGEFIGLEVSIKDRRRFPNEPGYWAYFSFGHEPPLKKVVGKNPAASCNHCHQTNAAQDYVFTQYYPVIRATREGN